MKLSKISFLILGLAFWFLMGSLGALAAEFRFAQEGQNINIDPGESIKNLYTAGNIISINGDIGKDLYTAGNVTTVEGNVENNFAGIGGTIIIKGDIGNNVHVAAGTVIIQGRIREDLFITGGNVLIAKSAIVGGDLVVGGGVVDLEGLVIGNVFIGSSEVIINGKIGGLTKLAADSVKVGEFAEIRKNLEYTAPKRADIHKNAKILGTVNFTQQTVDGVDKVYAVAGLFSVLTTFFLLKLVAYIAGGLVLVYLFKRIIKAVVVEGLDNLGRSLGLGFAVLFLAPVVGIILALTVIGLYLAGLLAVLYMLLLTLASIVAGITLGSWITKTLRKKESYSVGWLEVILGVLVLKIVWFIPFIGWLLCAAFMLISMGAITRLSYRQARTD